MALPTNVATSYPDDSSDPSIALHQQHHDKIHLVVNRFDSDATPTDGQVPQWNAAEGLYVPGTVPDLASVANKVDKGALHVNVKDPPYNAVGNGIADDTAALTAARNATASSGATLYVPKGTYLCSGLILNKTGQRWLLAEGAVIKAASSISGNLITITGASVVFEGGRIDGNRAGQSADRDGLVVSAANVTVRGVEVTNCRGNGIALASAAVGCHIVGNYSHDNGIISNASAGIQVVDGSRNQIIGNRCENNGVVSMGGANDGDGIRLQGTAGTGQNVVSGNICRNNARRGVKVQQSFATVSNNVFSGNGVAAIGVTNSANPQNTPTTITGNLSTGDYRGLQIDNSTCLVVSENVILSAVDHGLLANTGANQVVMSGNVISRGQRHGAVIQGAQDWTITGNQVLDNGQGRANRYGISLERDAGLSRDCSRVNVTGNTSHNTGAGNTQTHGFVLSGTAPDSVIFIGNNATNGVTTAFSLASRRTNSFEWGNAGTTTNNQDVPWGSFYMAAGTTIGSTSTSGFTVCGSPAHKLGFFGRTPVIQPAAVIAAPTQTGSYVQADVQAIATSLNDLISKLKSLGLIA